MNLSDNELYQLIQAVNKRSMFKSKSDIDYIEYMLRDVGFFRDLRKQIEDALYYQILKELQYECHMPYEPQVQIGDQSNKFYYIIEGKFLILTKSILSNADLQITSEINSVLISRFSELSPQGYLYAGQYFGEQVMMFDQSHTQTILPLEKSHMLVIKRDAYRRIIEYHSRKDDAEKFAFLSGVNLFSKWSAKTLRTLLPDIHEVNFISNQLIYSQGDVVDSVYVIIEGEVQLFKIFNRNPVPMAILGCKEYFGDDEILNQFRTHSARSLSCLKMYRIHKIKFLDHIPFDYSTLNYKDYHRSSQMKKVLSVKNNPTMYMTPVQSDVPLRQLRSESLSILKSPALRQQLLKRKDKNKTTTSLGSFYQVNEMLRKNYRKLDSLIKRESIDLKKTVCSQSPSRKNLRMAFSPSNSQEEISNEGHSRIHGYILDGINETEIYHTYNLEQIKQQNRQMNLLNQDILNNDNELQQLKTKVKALDHRLNAIEQLNQFKNKFNINEFIRKEVEYLTDKTMIDVYTHMDNSKIQMEHQTKLLNDFKGEHERISQILEQNILTMKKFKDQQQSNEGIQQQQLEQLIQHVKGENEEILKNCQSDLLNTITQNQKESKQYIHQLQNKLDKINLKYEELLEKQSLSINSNQTLLISEIANLQQQINEINKPFEITPQDRMKFTVQTQLISKFLKGELNKDYAEYFKNCFTHMLLRVEELQDLFKRLISELPPMYHRSRRNTTIQIGYRTKTQFNKLF